MATEADLDKDYLVPILHSMYSRSLQKHPLVAGLATILIGILITQGTMQGFVLCRGADGHIAIEAASGSERTCEAQAPLSQELPTLQAFLANGFALTHCGPCRDVALAHDSSFYIKPGFEHPQSDLTIFPGVAAGLILPPKAKIQSDKSFCLHKHPETPSRPLHLRSTLLLI